MPNLEHPDITKMNLTGELNLRGAFGIDAFGNEVCIGDEIVFIDGDFLLKEELCNGQMKLLDLLGATIETAGGD